MFRKAIGYLYVTSGSLLILIITYVWIFEGSLSFLQFLGASFLLLILTFQGSIYLGESRERSKTSTHVGDTIKQENVSPAYDAEKRNRLVAKLKSMSEPLLIPISEFFDGNYADYGSIGCNLYPKHPGIDVFRNTFEILLKRDDVESIYAHIAEVEPDEDCWPYTYMVYVFGSISREELESLTKSIQPTEIGDRRDIFSPIPKTVRALSKKPLNCLWWD